MYYNDFSLENEAKRKGAIELIKKLKAESIPITAVGLQGHLKMNWPTVEQEDATISDFARLGVKVMITEFDVDVVRATQENRTADINANAQLVNGANTYTNGLPAAVQQALAKRYAESIWRVSQTPRRHRARLLLGRDGRRFLAEHAGTCESSVAVRPQRPAQTGL